MDASLDGALARDTAHTDSHIHIGLYTPSVPGVVASFGLIANGKHVRCNGCGGYSFVVADAAKFRPVYIVQGLTNAQQRGPSEEVRC